MTSSALNKPCRVETEIIVPFFDVDQMHIVWHGHYYKYFEISRCELLASIDYGYERMRASGYGWPVVDTRIKYIKPAVFEQRLVVKSELTEYENRLKIDYIVADADSGNRLTKGHTIQVAVALESGEMCYVSPPQLKAQLVKHGYLA